MIFEVRSEVLELRVNSKYWLIDWKTKSEENALEFVTAVFIEGCLDLFEMEKPIIANNPNL